MMMVNDVFSRTGYMMRSVTGGNRKEVTKYACDAENLNDCNRVTAKLKTLKLFVCFFSEPVTPVTQGIYTGNYWRIW